MGRVKDNFFDEINPDNNSEPDDITGHLISRLTDSLIIAVTDPSVLADITDDEIDALRYEIKSAKQAKDFDYVPF